MPGRVLSCSTVCRARALVFRSSCPLATACDSAIMAAWRCFTMPNAPKASGSACANTAGVGKSWVNSGQGVASGWPNVSTTRWVNVRPAATVTCWPKMARTATSKPSSAPGTRMPSVPTKCAPSTALMAVGSASRSSAARVRAITVGRAGCRLSLNSSSTRLRASSKRKRTQPAKLSVPFWMLNVRVTSMECALPAMLSIAFICRCCQKCIRLCTS